MIGFLYYLRDTYGRESGTSNSYYRAIQILDEIFRQHDILNLRGQSLASIIDAGEIFAIYEFVKTEERKMKNGQESIFLYGNPKQRSYPLKGFCSAAVRSLFNYRESQIQKCALDYVRTDVPKSQLIKKLQRLTAISKTEVEAEVHQRIGQNVFRCILLEIYNERCCVCGLNIKELLRASHILPWSDNTQNRLNPENGLCLSATYDAAFDKHLISFDDDYRMVVSPYIRDFYTNEAAKEYFERYEGKQLELPNKFKPDKKLLRLHRERLIS